MGIGDILLDRWERSVSPLRYSDCMKAALRVVHGIRAEMSFHFVQPSVGPAFDVTNATSLGIHTSVIARSGRNAKESAKHMDQYPSR